MPFRCVRSCLNSDLGGHDPLQEAHAEIERLQHAVALYSEGSQREEAEIARLRATIKQAHGALTKSSLTPDERVHDATAVLSRHI